MGKRRKITEEQFEEAVHHILFDKPGESTIPEDYEPTEEELERTYPLDPPPPDQDE